MRFTNDTDPRKLPHDINLLIIDCPDCGLNTFTSPAMALTSSKKRKAQGAEARKTGRHAKRPRQSDYNSDASDASADNEGEKEDARGNGVRLPDSTSSNGAADTSTKRADMPSAEDESPDTDDPATSEDESDTGSDMSSQAASSVGRKRRKRDDPDVFANSLSKILNSKLTTSKRADPVLARSRAATEANQELADARLEAKARQKLRDEKKALLEKGRVKDVLGVERDGADGSSAEVLELERRLKKTAQRGVVKLFNAVRAAQVKGEQAAQEAKKEGVIGAKEREAKVNEMSKKGFLDLIAGGGKKMLTK